MDDPGRIVTLSHSFIKRRILQNYTPSYLKYSEELSNNSNEEISVRRSSIDYLLR